MEKEKKLGAGIITISVLILIGLGFTIFGTIINLTMGDNINKVLLEAGQVDTSLLPTTTDYIISLVTSAVNVIFVVLILMKNKVGVLGYFTVAILSNVYNLIISGISALSLGGLAISLAFLALYGFFIYKKRELYGFTKETIEAIN